MDNESPTTIFLPLRSNAAWFENADSRERLEREMKSCLALYDHVLLEDGRIRLTAGEDGQGMNIRLPKNLQGLDRTKITYFEKGRPFSIRAGDKPIMQSTCDTAYDVDFYPIAHAAGLENVSFVRWTEDGLNNDVRDLIDRQIESDLRNEALLKVLPPNRYLRKEVLRGLYGDAILAQCYNMPFCVDHHCEPILSLWQARAKSTSTVALPEIAYEIWVNLDLPDFAALSWNEVLELRESDAGISFRRMLHSVCRRAAEALPHISDRREIQDVVFREFALEVVRELSARTKTGARTALSLALNFISFGTVAGVATELADFGRDQASWVSLIKPPKP